MSEIIIGPYGTIFEFTSFRGSDELIRVSTKDGCFELATSDLATFYVEFNERLHGGPLIINSEASKYIKLAIQAAVEGKDAKIESLKEQLKDAVSFILATFSDGVGNFKCPLDCPQCDLKTCGIKRKYDAIMDNYNK
jgi:hypothetical protein